MIPYQPPSLSRDGKTAAVTSIPPDRLAEFLADEDMPMSTFQVGLVNVEQGGLRIVTNEPLGAAWPVLDPAGEKFSYFTPANIGPGSTLRVLELGSGRRTLVHVDEEDRMLALAEGAMERGEATLAVESLKDLLKRFPESRLKDYANFLLFQWSLSPAINRRDEAFDALAAMSDSQIQHESNRLFWDGFGKHAADPAADSFTLYANEDTTKSFGFDTDATRDLRAVNAGFTRDRLYVRVEYASGADITGSDLQDTLMLLDFGNSATPGNERITDAVKWDRHAEYSLLYRHWEEGGGNYDVELRHNGEVLRAVRITGGLSKPFDTFGRMKIVQDNTSDGRGGGAIVFALDASVFEGESFGEGVSIQVCTLKGGTEDGPPPSAVLENSHNPNLEKPRRPDSDQPPVCDIADAFGEIEELTPGPQPDQNPARCILKGSALSLKAK